MRGEGRTSGSSALDEACLHYDGYNPAKGMNPGKVMFVKQFIVQGTRVLVGSGHNSEVATPAVSGPACVAVAGTLLPTLCMWRRSGSRYGLNVENVSSRRTESGRLQATDVILSANTAPKAPWAVRLAVIDWLRERAERVECPTLYIQRKRLSRIRSPVAGCTSTMTIPEYRRSPMQANQARILKREWLCVALRELQAATFGSAAANAMRGRDGAAPLRTWTRMRQGSAAQGEGLKSAPNEPTRSPSR